MSFYSFLCWHLDSSCKRFSCSCKHFTTLSHGDLVSEKMLLFSLHFRKTNQGIKIKTFFDLLTWLSNFYQTWYTVPFIHVQSGGPSWEVPLGRRDSRDASISGSNNNIPAPNNTFQTILTKFHLHGLDLADLVALSGIFLKLKLACFWSLWSNLYIGKFWRQYWDKTSLLMFCYPHVSMHQPELNLSDILPFLNKFYANCYRESYHRKCQMHHLQAKTL